MELESTVHEYELASETGTAKVTITGIRTHLLPQFAQAYAAVDDVEIAKYLLVAALGEDAQSIWVTGNQAEFDRQIHVPHGDLDYTIGHYGINIAVSTTSGTIDDGVKAIVTVLGSLAS